MDFHDQRVWVVTQQHTDRGVVKALQKPFVRLAGVDADQQFRGLTLQAALFKRPIPEVPLLGLRAIQFDGVPSRQSLEHLRPGQSKPLRHQAEPITMPTPLKVTRSKNAPGVLGDRLRLRKHDVMPQDKILRRQPDFVAGQHVAAGIHVAQPRATLPGAHQPVRAWGEKVVVKQVSLAILRACDCVWRREEDELFEVDGVVVPVDTPNAVEQGLARDSRVHPLVGVGMYDPVVVEPIHQRHLGAQLQGLVISAVPVEVLQGDQSPTAVAEADLAGAVGGCVVDDGNIDPLANQIVQRTTDMQFFIAHTQYGYAPQGHPAALCSAC